MAVTSYWGNPNKISELVKTFSPKIVLPTWDQGVAPVFDQEPALAILT
jgi:hypothetical protein